MVQHKPPTGGTFIPEEDSVMEPATATDSTGQTRIARARKFITHHQLIAFFVLAFVFSWAIEFAIPASNAFSTLGSYGPFAAAVLLSAFLVPGKVGRRSVRRWVCFAVIFAVAVVVWIVFDPITNKHMGWPAGVACAATAAFLLSGFFSRRRGVRELLAPLATWRVGWSSYAVAFIMGPAILLLAVGLDLALGGELPAWPYGVPTIGLVVLSFLWIALFDGGMEEAGWRGFALPRLQSRFSPLVASVILGFFWALWHLPYYITGMYTSSSNTGAAGLTGILVRFVWVIPLALVFTWLYNRSRRSLLLLILLHVAFNTTNALVPLSARAGALMVFGTVWVFAIAVLVFGRMWRKQSVESASEVQLTEPQPPSRESREAEIITSSPSSQEPSAARLS
jgi:CAAX protease family protein